MSDNENNVHIKDSDPGMMDVAMDSVLPVEVQVSANGKTLWVNTHRCRLRICNIVGGVAIDDQRKAA